MIVSTNYKALPPARQDAAGVAWVTLPHRTRVRPAQDVRQDVTGRVSGPHRTRGRAR
ncbi:hypothetical protein GCM10025788_02960 [Serinicoccus chungangensis]